MSNVSNITPGEKNHVKVDETQEPSNSECLVAEGGEHIAPLQDSVLVTENEDTPPPTALVAPPAPLPRRRRFHPALSDSLVIFSQTTECKIDSNIGEADIREFIEATCESVEDLEDSEGNNNDNEAPPVAKDSNDNVVQWTSSPETKLLEHASCLFRKDPEWARHVERTINLVPRDYVIFNVFTDFARYVGSWRSKRSKRVAFPEAVMEQYEQKGDVAGKDRFVPAAKEAYRGIQPTKKRRLSAVYTNWSVKSTDFAPRVERIDDYSKVEHCCERKCMTCEGCLGPPSKTKDEVKNCMEGYMCDLNSASLFIHGHATRTFEAAVSTLEFVKLHRTSLLTVSSPLGATNYARHRIGVLSSSIWIFGYAVRIIINMAVENSEADNANSLPSVNGLRKILEQFAAMCLSIADSVKVILQYSYNFFNFCKECKRILNVLQIHVGFRGETKLKIPLRRGDGLELNKKLRKKDIVNQKNIQLMVAKVKDTSAAGGGGGDAEEEAVGGEDTADLEYKSFEELGGNEKLHCLKHLLQITQEGVTQVQTQLRFLVDDIVDSVKDVAEADLLFILADMHDRVRYLENAGPVKYTKVEMEQITRVMTEFSKDFQAFVDFGQHIMKRYVEIRDVTHCTYEYLTRGLGLEMLEEMVPVYTFKRRGFRAFCCGGEVADDGSGARIGKKRVVARYHPKYKPVDFFRVAYQEVVNNKYDIYANKYSIMLSYGNSKIGPVVPRPSQLHWGEMEGDSPKLSLEEYVDVDTEDEQQIEAIKPILLNSGSPLASPRGSITSNPDENGADQQPPTSTASPTTTADEADNKNVKKMSS